MRNLSVKKNGRGGVILTVTLTTQKEQDYLVSLLNYAPTLNIPYLGENATPENKTITAISEALHAKGAESDCLVIDSNVKRYLEIT